jgi:hypothetical protein
MIVAVSPYHLTTRELPVMASLLLAERVVTLLPAPGSFSSVHDVSRAVGAAPSYLEFMRSWEWSMPLWRNGVITAPLGPEGPAADVRRAVERIDLDPRYATLRSFMRPDLFGDPDRLLEALSRDLNKGGPDPALSVPVCAGLDAFAARHDLPIARSEPASLSQRAEGKLGELRGRIVLPAINQAPAQRLLEARQWLAPELEPLRDAFAAFLRSDARSALAELRAAVRTYSGAFDAILPDLVAPIDEEIRVMTQLISVTIERLPGDAVLRSSEAAAATATGTRARRTSRAAAPSSLVAESPVTTMIFRRVERTGA